MCGVRITFGSVPVREAVRQRLVAERVEGGAADAVVAQRPDQRGVVDEPAARHVDQPGVALHRRRARPRRSCPRSRGVRGAASTTMSDSASRSWRPSGPDEAIDRGSTGSRRRHDARAAGALAAGARGRRRMAMTRAPERGSEARDGLPERAVARRCRSSASRSSRPSSGCQVRSCWSSGGCGRCRLTARIMSRTCSAIGREKTPRAFVTSTSRAKGGGRQRALHAGRRGMDPGEVRRPREQAVERLGDQPAAKEHLDVVDAGRRPGPRPTGLTMREPGATARIRSRSLGLDRAPTGSG